MEGSKLVTNGGRVLNVVALGDKFKVTQNKVYKNIPKINFDQMHYRNDIGNKCNL
jgi:phosphoribosylamine-glycine ligase